MEKKKVRIAVLGAGLIGAKHIDVLRTGDAAAGYELAGVVDISPDARQDAERHGYACYPTLAALCDAAGPDGVIIALPNRLHAPAGLECIERGIPILIEKPVADTMSDAVRLVSAAEAAGIPTLTGHHRRHNPIMQRAAATIREGALGRIVAANSVWMTYKPKGYHDLAWRREPGGGPVLINAIHDIDCLRMLCGAIDTVQAITSNATRGFAVEDTAGALLRFENGAIGTLLVSDTAVSPWSWETTSGENPFFPRIAKDSIVVAGTKGAIAIPTLESHTQEDGRQNWGEPLATETLSVENADPYILQMRNFADVIRGEAEPVLTGRGGVETLAATLAITLSAEAGAPVRVADVLAEASE